MKKVIIAAGLALSLALAVYLPNAFGVVGATLVGDANYTVVANDTIIETTTAFTAPRTWTLPSASVTNIGTAPPSTGRGATAALQIIDQAGAVGSTNTLTITPASGETINGSTSSIVLNYPRARYILIPVTGSAWVGFVDVIPGQTPGTATNDNAAPGNIGEVITVNIPLTSAKQLTTNSAITLGNVALTGGDWDCRGTMAQAISATTTVTQLSASISQTDGVFGTQGTDGTTQFNLAPVSATLYGPKGIDLKLGPARQSISGTTNVFLVAGGTFATSQLWAFGSVTCRRAR